MGTELGLKKEDIISGGSGYSNASVTGKFKALVMTKVKSYLPKSIKENNIDILEIDEHLDEISQYLGEILNQTLENYGLTIPEFYITNIATPDDDPNYRRLKQQHAERYLKIQEERIKKEEAKARKDRVLVEAETAAEVKLVGVKAEEETTRRMAYAEAERIRAEGLAHADVMKAQGFTYQQETQREIGIRAAESEGGTGGIAAGIVQAGIGLGVGVAVAKETVGAVGSVMSDVQTPTTPKDGWKCPACGHEGNLGKFCEECGAKKPEAHQGWTCPTCGYVNGGKFCEECGTKKPEASTTWTCPICGHINTGKFCEECGSKKE